MVILAYYVLLSIAVTLARGGTLAALPAMWMPNAIVVLLTAYFMRRAGRDQPLLPGLALLRRRKRTGATR